VSEARMSSYDERLADLRREEKDKGWQEREDARDEEAHIRRKERDLEEMDRFGDSWKEWGEL